MIKQELAGTIGEWEYLGCSCLVSTGTGVTAYITYQCGACNNTNLRFIHTLEHVKDKRQIQVGIKCARVLMDDWELPRLAENETKRKERWRREVHNRPGHCSTTIQNLKDRGKL